MMEPVSLFSIYEQLNSSKIYVCSFEVCISKQTTCYLLMIKILRHDPLWIIFSYPKYIELFHFSLSQISSRKVDICDFFVFNSSLSVVPLWWLSLFASIVPILILVSLSLSLSLLWQSRCLWKRISPPGSFTLSIVHGYLLLYRISCSFVWSLKDFKSYALPWHV